MYAEPRPGIEPTTHWEGTATDHSTGAGSSRQTITRRTVVRTAAHTAWAAPTIVVLAAAPAFAASGPAAVTATLLPPTRVGTTLPLVASITNGNTQPTINLVVKLDITITSALTTVGVTSTTPAGYTLTATSYPSANRVVFTFTADTQLAGNGAQPFNPTVTLSSTGAATPSGTAHIIPSVDAPGTATPSAVQPFA